MTGKVVKPFAGLTNVGETGPPSRHLQWVVYVPFVPDAGKFKGELITSIHPI